MSRYQTINMALHLDEHVLDRLEYVAAQRHCSPAELLELIAFRVRKRKPYVTSAVARSRAPQSRRRMEPS